MTDVDEKQLVRQAQAGDQGAMGDILTRYQDRLYNIILRMVNNRDDAAELTQDAMLKVIENLGCFDHRSALSTWIIRIALNLSVSHFRKKKLRRAVSLDALANGTNGDQSSVLRAQLVVDSREPSPDQCVQNREMIAKLNLALTRIEAEFRAVVVLRDIEQMDYQTISKVLSLPLGTVKSRLFRARLALRKQILRLESSSAAGAAPNPEMGNG